MTYALSECAILLHPDDDVAVLKKDLSSGAQVETGSGRITLAADIPAGHKLALRPRKAREQVRKYGQVIGVATQEIRPGDHVHLHNLGMDRRRQHYEFATELRPPAPPPPTDPVAFAGFRRKDGRVGTRNYVAVLSTTNCSASATAGIVAEARARLLSDFPNVSGILSLTHATGCAAPMGGPDYRLLQRTLAGYADHPNVGAAMFVGLGCEGNQAAALLEDTGLLRIAHGQPPPIVTIQESGGTQKARERGVRVLADLLARANGARRTPEPLSQLTVGLQCGGSDGNSGITANPALGMAMDRLVAHGGTAILAETPEIYGAEHLLTRRCVSKEVGEWLLEKVRWWEWYTGIWGATINNNPAPGNKAGGLTTIFEKSLGACAKGGTTPLREVYAYAERVRERGLVFMDTPGNDPVSVTGLVAGGANLIAFTTGRGSCYGCVPSPSLKIASNTPLYERMSDDVDIDAGVVLAGTPLEQVADAIFRALVEVASGTQTKSERQGIGEEEFAPWVLGPVL